MKSIRRALTVQLVTGMLVMLVAASTILGAAVHSRLVREFDRALETKARVLAVLTSRKGQTIEVDFAGEYMPEFESEDDPEYFQILLQDGSVIKTSDTLDGHRLPFKPSRSDEPLFLNSRLPDGRRGRLVQMALRPRADEQGDTDPQDEERLFQIPGTLNPASVLVILTVARSRKDLDALLISLYVTLAAIDLLLLLGIGILVHLSIRKGLQPVETINRQVSAIGPEALDRRIHLPFPPKELQTILHALNNLLERLQRAFERERRFSSDVAHELRTPVAELRTACEVGGRWPEDTDSVRHFFSDARGIALQMERIVTSLLVLARCDSGTTTVAREAVHIASLIRECWNRVSEDATIKQLRLDLRIAPSITVSTDREKFEMIIRNLIDNAVCYSAPGSVITCAADGTGPGLDLVTGNQAVDLANEDLEHMFERFWRKDPARSDRGHLGLGLSIVKALSELLGIGLRIDLKESAVFEVRLSFPAEALR